LYAHSFDWQLNTDGLFFPLRGIAYSTSGHGSPLFLRCQAY
jgi:hypothetical protein